MAFYLPRDYDGKIDIPPSLVWIVLVIACLTYTFFFQPLSALLLGDAFVKAFVALALIVPMLTYCCYDGESYNPREYESNRVLAVLASFSTTATVFWPLTVGLSPNHSMYSTTIVECGFAFGVASLLFCVYLNFSKRGIVPVLIKSVKAWELRLSVRRTPVSLAEAQLRVKLDAGDRMAAMVGRKKTRASKIIGDRRTKTLYLDFADDALKLGLDNLNDPKKTRLLDLDDNPSTHYTHNQTPSEL